MTTLLIAAFTERTVSIDTAGERTRIDLQKKDTRSRCGTLAPSAFSAEREGELATHPLTRDPPDPPCSLSLERETALLRLPLWAWHPAPAELNRVDLSLQLSAKLIRAERVAGLIGELKGDEDWCSRVTCAEHQER